ncbi:MAG: RNA pyrophosphohydrolase [Rhodospirillales bacterium]|nr:RNA pyrophosphohydrolase [Alphaproteobacteria bacterium]MCB9977385.1 RNA pyrophosphohydrolase [Rhodospirillales bacterium]
MTEKKAPSNLPYRPCVGIVLLNKDNKVFVGERLDTPGAWQMPQGGIDPDEDIKTAALRELREETGTNEADIIRISEQKLHYDLPEPMIPKLWGGTFRGQEQTWVAARFRGKDSDICLTAHDPPEFRNWRWIRLQDTVDYIVPFKRETYRRVIAMFEDLV